MASVRRLFGWMAGLVGIAALARYLARRERAQAAPPPRRRPEADPADELRRKLSEARAEPAAAEEPLPEPASPPGPRASRSKSAARASTRRREAAIAEMQETAA